MANAAEHLTVRDGPDGPDEQHRVLAELLAIVRRSKLGDRLPAERRLAEQLGVGRSAVRSALRELSHHELIATRRQAGSFVTAPGPAGHPLSGRPPAGRATAGARG